MTTILGILLLIAPYILIFHSSHKFRTALSVFTFTSLAYISIAIVTQAFHVFTYGVILVLHALVALCSLYLFKYKRGDGSAETKGASAGDSLHSHRPHVARVSFVQKLKYNIFPIFFLLLSVVLLYSIHFNFSGYADSAVGLRNISHSSYTYPLYSDEWVGASFADYSIRTGQLPFVNPLDRDTPFPNFLFITHSLVADLILILGLSAVTSYVYFAMLNALAVSAAVFFILRAFGVRNTIASIAGFSTLLLTNSGNLPGIWFLLPYAVSLTFLLYSILCIKVGENEVLSEKTHEHLNHVGQSQMIRRDQRMLKLGMINSALALFIYPPMIVFIIPIWLAYYGDKVSLLKKIYIALLACATVVVAYLILFVSSGFQAGQTFSKAMSYLIRNPLDIGMVYYAPWNVIPAFILLFVIIGLYFICKEKKNILLYPILIGVLYWIIYTFVQIVFIIEPARTVVVTSVFLILAAGFGLEAAYDFAKKKAKNTFLDVNDSFIAISLKILTMGFFIFWAMHISKFGLWHKMPLTYDMKIVNMKGEVQHQQRQLIPAPPVTRYLDASDLRLFSGFEGKRFVAPPWKGLAIGVATHNYPLDSKSSMITNNILSYGTFASADCTKKKEYAKKYRIELSYGASTTTCSGFTQIGRSSEGLYLYSVDSSK